MSSAIIIPTISRTYTALAQWLSCVIFILIYRRQRRLKLPLLCFVSVVFLVAIEAEMNLTEDLPLALWIPAIIGAAVLMFMYLFICLDITWATAGYMAVQGFILAELAASLEWQLYYYCVEIYEVNNGSHYELLFVAIIYVAVYATSYIIMKRLTDNGRCIVIRPRVFVMELITGAAIFALSNLSFATGNTPFSGNIAPEIYNIRTLVDLGGVAVLLAFHYQQKELVARSELDAINNALQLQYTQYKMSRDSIDVINRKYHDLKHQIGALRAETDAKKREAWIDTIENDIKTYEAQNKTGDSVLDTVLTSKSLYCQQNDITLTCVADGTALKFMDAMDICTIFGNALDNAIDAVKQVEEKDKRLIRLSASAQKGFVLIQTENYFEGELKFMDGNPVSTKKDRQYHGFGVKSIRYSAQRYGGNVSIRTQDNWFDLKVLIPIPQTS